MVDCVQTQQHARYLYFSTQCPQPITDRGARTATSTSTQLLGSVSYPASVCLILTLFFNQSLVPSGVFSGKPSSWTIFTCGKATVQRNSSCVQKNRVGAAHAYNQLSDQTWRKGQRHDLFRPRLLFCQDRVLLQAGGSYNKPVGLLRLKRGPSSSCHVRLAGPPAVDPSDHAVTQPLIRSRLIEGGERPLCGQLSSGAV